jgi:hypothetical protein
MLSIYPVPDLIHQEHHIKLGRPIWKKSDRARNMHEEALVNCKMVEGGKVAGEGGHIEKMHTLQKLANDTGGDIKDSWFITKLLNYFLKSWDAVITPMYSETNLSMVIMN